VKYLAICMFWTAFAVEITRTVTLLVLTTLVDNTQDPIQVRLGDFVELYFPTAYGVLVQAVITLALGSFLWMFSRSRRSSRA
jgi:hypothetical protein